MVEPAPAGGFKTRPSVGDQVSFTVRRVHAANAPTAGTVAQDAELERYLLGCGAQCRAVEVALETMREGEVATFLCKERHLPAPNIESVYPEEVTIRLAKIFRDVDLTPRPSPGGKLIKRKTRWGDAKTHGQTLYEPMTLSHSPRPGYGSDAGRDVARPGCRVIVYTKHKPTAVNANTGLDAEPWTPMEFTLRSTAVDAPPCPDGVHEALELSLTLASPGERFEVTFPASVYGFADDRVDGTVESDAVASARFAETYDTSGDLVTTEVHVRAVHPPAPFAPEHAGPGGWGGTRDVGLDGEDLWTMPKWERAHRAKAAKERGVALFKAGRHRAALRAYDVAIRLLTAPFAPLDLSKVEMPEWDPPSEQDPLGKDPHLKLAERYGSNAWRGLADSGLGEGNENQVLLKATILNASLAASRRGDHATCEWYCSKALAEDPMCVKGWFRRGRARVAMHRWDEAEDDLNRAERLQGDDEISKELDVERKKLAAGRKKSESGGAVAKAFRAVFGGGGGGAGEYPKPKEMRRLVTGDLGIEAGPAHPTGRLDIDEPGAQLDELLDETSPHTRMEHALNKALHYEQIGLNEFVDSGMPIELYSEAELAPVGEGHPTAQAVEKREYVVPFGEAEAAELDAEIAEREHDEELYDKMLNAAKRGNRVQRGTATHNPWDRDGTKAVDELNMQFVKEYNEQKMEEAKEEMEAHKKQWHERKSRATGDDIGLD